MSIAADLPLVGAARSRSTFARTTTITSTVASMFRLDEDLSHFRALPLPPPSQLSVRDPDRISCQLDEGGTSSLWWATKNEWLGLLDVAGLELEALFGSFDRKPLDDDSREYVFVARR